LKGVSVIICCYNSGTKLLPTLTHLANQVFSEEFPFELIVVDNNCSDDTVKQAQNIWTSLKNPFPLNIFYQSIPGLKHARDMGIGAAKYEYIVFCDDDNWLCNNYLVSIIRIFETFADVMIIGGVGEAVFDSKPPEWFFLFNGFGYAIGSEGRKTGFVESVYGAGMSCRKTIFNKLGKSQFKSVLIGRKGNELSSGEDIELCIWIRKLGYFIYLDTTLTFKHSLSKNRLTWRYYLKLRKSFGIANSILSKQYNYLTSKKENKNSVLFNVLSMTKFLIFNLKYFFFFSLIKSEKCAAVHQEFAFRLTKLRLKKSYKV
jgi:glycosyltransferase involved in cell wall biosynthesis